MSESLPRRTFAIISHPDAGKTTLTEKLLLFGGAINQAGAVKAKGDQRRATSDWMAVEKQRGISVTASVMTFDWQDHQFNLLDTPGHQDFSEDTYRTLTAVDSAIMVLDAAKGIEAQTRKLFEICRLRDIPIITFINKLDREARDPFDLLDEIEQNLALDVTPMTIPIGMGQEFMGCYNLQNNTWLKFDKTASSKVTETQACTGLDDLVLKEAIPQHLYDQLLEHVDMAQSLCPSFDQEAYNGGMHTPVFFGAAINNFGVRELLQAIQDYAPPPQSFTASQRQVCAEDKKVAGFVFKVQANMDPKHRDRIAFVRLVSGHFKRGMKLTHSRTQKQLAVFNPMLFLAENRALAEEAHAGDIIGIPGHGNLRIGDTLTEGEVLQFTGIPSFAPELLQRARVTDPLKAKHLSKALNQLAEEGSAHCFRPVIGSDYIVGVVGALQFEVLKSRIQAEYNLDVLFEPVTLYAARWVTGEAVALKEFADKVGSACARDVDEDLVFLARNAWHLQTIQEEWKNLTFCDIKHWV